MRFLFSFYSSPNEKIHSLNRFKTTPIQQNIRPLLTETSKTSKLWSSLQEWTDVFNTISSSEDGRSSLFGKFFRQVKALYSDQIVTEIRSLKTAFLPKKLFHHC